MSLKFVTMETVLPLKIKIIFLNFLHMGINTETIVKE